VEINTDFLLTYSQQEGGDKQELSTASSAGQLFDLSSTLERECSFKTPVDF
jgi:hypothetical protein